MPTVIRKSRPSDNNLPRIVAGRRVTVTIHRSGRLAGHTTVEGDQRSIRVLPAASTWRPVQGQATQEKPASSPEAGAWEAEVLSGSVKVVKAALVGLTAEEVALLHAAEKAGANRVGVLKAIDKWEPTS